MATPPAPDRTRATRLRMKVKARQTLMPEEAAWLHQYEEDREVARGASASRKVSFTEEEHQAVGIGTAAAEAAAAASMVREEGRRIDNIIERGFAMMTKACEMSFALAEQVLKDKVEDAKTQRALLESVREHYLARTQIEADKIVSDAVAEADAAAGEGGDAITKMAEQMLPMLMPAIMAQMGGKK